MSKKFLRIMALVMALAMLVSFAACKGNNTPGPTNPANPTEPQPTAPATVDLNWAGADGKYTRLEDEDVYDAILGGYTELLEKAKAADTIDKRFMYFAQAEAYLLDSAVMIPTTTQGGAYTISRVAPRTVPYVQWGNDDDRLKGMVISDEFCTPAERADMLAEWAKAVAGEGKYDPAAYLTGKGHTLQTTYTTTFSTPPATLDWLNTSYQSDTELTVNTVDGLVEYNNLGQMTPALAESWEVSEDGLTVTFKIRQGAYWYTSEGQQYAEVTAEDFVAGLRHMLDCQEGLEWLVDGVIAGATAYYSEGGSWDDVGYKATDKYTLTVTLEQPVSYFLTMLTYSCFLPICDSFYQSRGGVYGVEEYAAAVQDTATYTFGSTDDVASQVYCGPYLIDKFNSSSEIVIKKNPNYYKADEVTLETIKWVHDSGENLPQLYKDTVAGTYAGITLSTAGGLLDLAKEDGNFDKYSYISDTNSTSYFGGLNLNRGTFVLESGAAKSPKAEDEKAKIETATALANKNFRKALQFAYDKATVNAIRRGEDLKETNLRNMYTHPEFVQLSADVTDDNGKTFAAGTFYGEMVQYYCDQLGAGITVKDGVNGWYNKEKAVEYLNKAVEELGDSVSYPIQIDVVYYSASETITNECKAYKQVIEEALGTDRVIVNLLETTVDTDYYAAGYRSAKGETADYDMFFGSGWGPDYGDPSTYLDTFAGMGAGYMTKVIGLF